MPFDEDEDKDSKKPGLNKVSGQKSMFSNVVKKPTQDEFEKRVYKNEETVKNYQTQVSDLSSQFLKIMKDKTLEENKTAFDKDFEKDVLQKIINLCSQINNDEAQQEGYGSMVCVALALRTCFLQRSRINQLEYTLSKVKHQLSDSDIKKLIEVSVASALDKAEKK